MGLDVALNKIKNNEKLIEDIERYWLSKKQDDKFKFVNSYLIASSKWKFDYIIFEKDFNFCCK